MAGPGIKKLRYLQLGQESSAAKGTEVDADILWMGLGTLEDARENVWPEENVGIISGTTRVYTPKLQGLLHMDEVEATFEQLPHIFEASIEHEAASVDTGGAGYIYEYNPGVTANTEIISYTVEAGDDHMGELMTYAFVTEWTLSGVAGEAVMMSAEWVGRDVVTAAKTGALTATTPEIILMSMGKLYIDGTAATHGTTQIVNQWLEFELNYVSGFQPIYTGDGQKYFSFEKGTGSEITLTLKLEHDSAATVEKLAWRNHTARAIRLDFTGTTLSSSGALYDAKHLIIDLTGQWESFDVLEDDDGDDTLTGTFVAKYDSVFAHYADITVVNALSALP